MSKRCEIIPNDYFLPFLVTSYILNRGWIDKSQKKTPHYKEIVREEDFDELEKSEDELDAADEFESKYNFRFEDA